MSITVSMNEDITVSITVHKNANKSVSITDDKGARTIADNDAHTTRMTGHTMLTVLMTLRTHRAHRGAIMPARHTQSPR